MRRSALLLALVTLLIFTLPARLSQASGAAGNDQADVVYGQPSMFTSTCAAASASALCDPVSDAVDDTGNLWIADRLNNRVLMYVPGSTTASRVLGQPNLTSSAAGLSTSTMDTPQSVAIDSNGTLYVADTNNNRALVFFHAASKASGAAANLVLGQPNFTSNTANNPGTTGGGGACPVPGPASPCTLQAPVNLTTDRYGDLVVMDLENNRVLLWPAADFDPGTPVSCASSCFIPATQSWGQYGSLATTDANQSHTNGGSGDLCPTNTIGQISQCTLSGPFAAAVDAQDDLFIADASSNRVLEYDNAVAAGSTRQAATMVYGLGGSFTTGTLNAGGLSASSLNSPTGIVVDSAGNVWIADEHNNRVLEYPPAVTSNRTVAATAIGVLGQRGSFVKSGLNQNGLDAGSLARPRGLAVDGSGDLFVTEGTNDRLLEYQQPYSIVARVALAAGWNLVSIADSAQLQYTASSVAQQIDNQGGSASEVAVFSGGAYAVFVPGFSTDFTISPKQGVWVLSGGSTVWAQS